MHFGSKQKDKKRSYKLFKHYFEYIEYISPYELEIMERRNKCRKLKEEKTVNIVITKRSHETDKYITSDLINFNRI